MQKSSMEPLILSPHTSEISQQPPVTVIDDRMAEGPVLVQDPTAYAARLAEYQTSIQEPSQVATKIKSLHLKTMSFGSAADMTMRRSQNSRSSRDMHQRGSASSSHSRNFPENHRFLSTGAVNEQHAEDLRLANIKELDGQHSRRSSMDAEMLGRILENLSMPQSPDTLLSSYSDQLNALNGHTSDDDLEFESSIATDHHSDIIHDAADMNSPSSDEAPIRVRRFSLPGLSGHPRMEHAVHLPGEFFRDTVAKFRNYGRQDRERSRKMPDIGSLVKGELPEMSYALSVPFFAYSRDEHGRKGIPVIFSLIHVSVSASHIDDEAAFKVELTYGDTKWIIYRSMVDFLKLHSLLTFRHLQGRLPAMPKFPSHLSYPHFTFRHGNNSITPEERRAQAAASRCQKLEAYLIKLFQKCNLRIAHDIYVFLELSRSSIGPDIGVKGKEGYVKKRSGDKRSGFWHCFTHHVWHTRWVVVRDSFIAYYDAPEDEHPGDVLLLDSKTNIEHFGHWTKHALRRRRFAVKSASRVLNLRPDNDRQALEWRFDIQRTLHSSPWCQPKRFGSFAPMRHDAQAQWYVDGRDYLQAIGDAISNAKNTIYIQGWWVSPELQLKRPGSQFPELRLDNLLKRKAEEGVKIYITVYKELTFSLGNMSQYTKQTLMALHPNIIVQRFPDHNPGGIFYWAMHDKVVNIDEEISFIGGIDLCFGRYDRHEHSIGDFSQTEIQEWTGKDYSNPRIADFKNVDEYWKELIDRTVNPRMPWHDIHAAVIGIPARDIARHFVERWNFVKESKARDRVNLPYLLPPTEISTSRAKARNWTGTCGVQILRSACSWSIGSELETSIYSAYQDMIENSKHYIYIENQFFVSRADDGPDGDYPIKNRIGQWIAEAIIRAHKEGRKFRVYVCIPLLPAFENEIADPGGATIRIILNWQGMSINRGENCIFARLIKEGIDPEQYITFSSLRAHGPVVKDAPESVEGPLLLTEQVYIHSKLIIVDDRRVLIGSANINDRSMLGFRDGETAMIVEDTEMIESRMGGKPFRASKYAHTLRLQVMSEHTGLALEDLTLLDPVVSEFYDGLWRKTAFDNAILYRNAFHCLPDDTIATWNEYEEFRDASQQEIDVSGLSGVKGHLVTYPLNFVSEESLSAIFPAVEFILPLEVFI